MLKKDCNENTFVKITNSDIYNKLCDLENHVKETNGKVKFHTKMIFAVTGVLTTAIIFFANIVIK